MLARRYVALLVMVIVGICVSVWYFIRGDGWSAVPPSSPSHSSLVHILATTNQCSLPQIGNFTKKYWINDPLMPRRVTHEEYEAMIDLMRVADAVLRYESITYIMSGGTLIGSYFHHDMVPWDDDLDIYADASKWDQLVSGFTSLGAPFGISKMGKNEWMKLYRTDGKKSRQRWQWPFIDVWLYNTNASHWWQHKKPYTTIPLDAVFPTYLRPFGPLWLPSPRDVLLSLFKTEDPPLTSPRECRSNGYNHIREEGLTAHSVPCEKLMGSYPFVVERQSTDVLGQFVEILRIGNDTVQQVIVSGPS